MSMKRWLAIGIILVVFTMLFVWRKSGKVIADNSLSSRIKPLWIQAGSSQEELDTSWIIEPDDEFWRDGIDYEQSAVSESRK
jgi:hypothetical protein